MKATVYIQGIIGHFSHKIAVFLIFILGLIFSCNILANGGNEPPPKNDLSTKDSLAVRAILDTNGLKNVKVRNVIYLYNSLVQSISIDSLKTAKFIFPSQCDSFSGSIGIKISNSSIDTIIFHDSIHIPLSISISHTKLRSIPDQISLLKGTLDLNFAFNQLYFISPQIMNCRVNFVNINNNNLCSLSDSLKNWLIQKSYGDSTWLKTQNCP